MLQCLIWPLAALEAFESFFDFVFYIYQFLRGAMVVVLALCKEAGLIINKSFSYSHSSCGPQFKSIST